MPRPPRADEAGGIYHALNRGNSRSDIFRKEGDFEAFKRILAEGLKRYDVELFCYQLMTNHWHLVLRPHVDGEMSRFLRWVTTTHMMRYHAHYHTTGEDHVYQGRFKSFAVQNDGHFLTMCRYVERNALRAKMVRRAKNWRWGSLWRWIQDVEPDPALLSAWPISRSPYWLDKVNLALTDRELAAVRHSVQRGSPFGETVWIKSTAKRLGLSSTLRPRGRPRVRFQDKMKTMSPDPFSTTAKMKLTRTLAVILVASSACVAFAQKSSDSKRPTAKSEKLLGTWVLVSAERNGQRIDRSSTPAFVLTIDEGVLSNSRFPNDRQNYRLDNTRMPKQIDRFLAASKKWQMGIYEVNGDTLKICWVSRDGPRPDKFATGEDDLRLLQEYRMQTIRD